MEKRSVSRNVEIYGLWIKHLVSVQEDATQKVGWERNIRGLNAWQGSQISLDADGASLQITLHIQFLVIFQCLF